MGIFGLTDSGCSMGGGTGIFGWLLMILFWGALIWLIVWLIMQNQQHKKITTHATHTNPQETLKSRFAKGEITAKEYHEMKKELADEE